MRKIKLLTVAMILGLAMVGGVFTGCVIENQGVFDRYKEYTSAEQYAVGAKEYSEEVNKINIDFIAGEVKLVSSTTATSITVEEVRRTDDEERFVRSAVINNELLIKFCKGGISTFNCSSWQKSLTITLPEKVYSSIEFNGSDASLSATDINAKDITLDTVSGKINYAGLASNLEIDSVSGNIEFMGDVEKSVDVDSGSGKVAINGNIDGNVNIDSGSGEITLKGLVAGSCDIDSMSGDVNLALSKASSIDVDTTSGKVVMYLNSGFACTYSSFSGRFSSTYSCTDDNGTYTYGDGAVKIDVETLSGNLEIKELEA